MPLWKDRLYLVIKQQIVLFFFEVFIAHFQDLIEPLLQVIKVSSMHREENELHDRAQGFLNNRICHSREARLISISQSAL